MGIKKAVADRDRNEIPANVRTAAIGRHLNGFLWLSLKDRTILFLKIFLDKIISVGQDSLGITTLAQYLPTIYTVQCDKRGYETISFSASNL